MQTAASIGFVLLLVGCAEDRVQSIVNSTSPDYRYVAIVRNVLAENTTGSAPELFIVPASQELRSRGGHVVGGNLNGSFAASWVSPDTLVVEYRAGEGASRLPAATNFGGITIAFKQSQGRQ